MLARLLMVLLLFAGSAFAQTTAIRAGHLIDPATGTVARNQTILIEDGKITEVGANVKIPAGAEVVDLSDSWVLPGLMDAHTHLTFGYPADPPPGFGIEAAYLKEGSAFRALRGAWNARLVLEAGFTVVKEIGNDANYASTDLRRAIRKGWFAGPTILTTGKIIAPFGGQSDNIAPEQGPFWQFEYIDADTPEEVRKAVRRNIYYGADAIKLVADDTKGYYYSLEEIRAAVDEAHKAGITVAVHVIKGEAARNVILGGADSIEHGWELSDELLGLMKEKGTVLVGTDFPEQHLLRMGGVGGQSAKESAEKIIDRLRRAHRLGVKMAFGTDVVVEIPDQTRAKLMLDYLDVWLAAGIPPAKILKCMTTNAAELMQIEDERGAIRAGLEADIIATPENPLENIQALRNVHFVMKNGQLIKHTK